MLVAARLIGLFRGLVFLRHWQRTISDFILRNSTGIWSSLKFNVIRHMIEICSSKDDPFHYLLLIRPMIEFFYPLLKIKQHAYTLSLHFSTRQQKQSICALRSHTANMKIKREKKPKNNSHDAMTICGFLSSFYFWKKVCVYFFFPFCLSGSRFFRLISHCRCSLMTEKKSAIQCLIKHFRIVYSVIENINSKSSYHHIKHIISNNNVCGNLNDTKVFKNIYKRIFRWKGTVVTVWHDQREFINDTKNQNIFWIVQASINNTWIFCMLFQMI